jgi:hypothetical protein
MKYYYELDSKNRFIAIIPENKMRNPETELPYFESTDTEMIPYYLNNYGIIDNQIVLIAKNQEEIDMLKPNEKEQKIGRVVDLKKMLTDSDYQIIKCYEAFMRQQTLPYNLEELSAQRDAWRAEINELEEELKNL